MRSPRVVLDDQLIVDGERGLLARRLTQEFGGELALVELQKRRAHALALSVLERELDADVLLQLRIQGHDVADLDLDGGDARGLAVDLDVPVPHDLPGGVDARGEADAPDDVVETQLEALQEGRPR